MDKDSRNNCTEHTQRRIDNVAAPVGRLGRLHRASLRHGGKRSSNIRAGRGGYEGRRGSHVAGDVSHDVAATFVVVSFIYTPPATTTILLGFLLKTQMKTPRQVPWRRPCSGSCSPARATGACGGGADGWAVGIEEHIDGTPLVLSSHSKTIEHHIGR